MDIINNKTMRGLCSVHDRVEVYDQYALRTGNYRKLTIITHALETMFNELMLHLAHTLKQPFFHF